jgi:hypothetical protein
MIILLALVWLAIGIVSYGFWVGSVKKSFSYFRPSIVVRIACLLFGPLGAVSTYLSFKAGGKFFKGYGFSLKQYTDEERYSKFREIYSYDYKTFEEFIEEYP